MVTTDLSITDRIPTSSGQTSSIERSGVVDRARTSVGPLLGDPDVIAAELLIGRGQTSHLATFLDPEVLERLACQLLHAATAIRDRRRVHAWTQEQES